MQSDSPDLAAIVLDLGNVVVEWDPRFLFRRLFDDAGEMEWFLRNVCTPSWNAELDRGRPFADAVAELQAQYPEWAEEIEAYRARWPEMLGKVDEGTAAILHELDAAGSPVYALTNWSGETFPIAVERHPILKVFSGIVISGHEGVAKPDPEIFRILCRRYGLTPSETLFVDDLETNVEAAEALGFRVHHFVNAEHLRAELESRGLLRELRNVTGRIGS